MTPSLPVQDVIRQQYEIVILGPLQHNEIIEPFVSFQLSKLSQRPGYLYMSNFCSCGVSVGAILIMRSGRGVLIGKVGTGMCSPDRVLFRPLRFTNGPFFI